MCIDECDCECLWTICVCLPVYLGSMNVSIYILYKRRHGGVIVYIVMHTEVCVSEHLCGQTICV